MREPGSRTPARPMWSVSPFSCLWGSMSDNSQTALVLTLLALIAFGGVLSLGF
jgi:hypothetical protein